MSEQLARDDVGRRAGQEAESTDLMSLTLATTPHATDELVHLVHRLEARD